MIHLVLPTGTKVLVRATGEVALVNGVVDGRYLVRYADGRQAHFTRRELTIFKHEDNEIPGAVDAAALYAHVQYRCITGSQAYGLAHEASDVDRRGFFLPPADLHWSLAGVPEQLESDHEEVYWEAGKFVRLALKANPNVLECLYSPLIETCTPIAQELLDMRHQFLSKHVHRTYNSYVLSQFKKIEQDMRNQQAPRWKHVMHLIRLLLSGITVLEEGFIPLRMDAHRDRLLAIRHGQTPWDEVERWRLALHRRLDNALASTTLPEHPDYAAANAFLIRARRSAL
jgi:uncharacterized protein